MSDHSHYQRNLPHWLPHGEVLFITFRLAGTLPNAMVEALRAEWEALDQHRNDDTYARQKRYFGRYDALLDAATVGPQWLPAVAK